MGELQEIKVTQFIQETASLGEIKWFRLEFKKTLKFWLWAISFPCMYSKEKNTCFEGSVSSYVCQ